MNLCPECLCETSNPKFCSSSCAAKHNNKLFPKRKTQRKCLLCENFVKSYRHNRCEFHWEEYLIYKKENKYQDKTIGEYRNMPSVKGKHPSWIHSHVRNFAKSWLKDLTKQPCLHCGYNKHVELAHIKGVSEFDDSALLSEVNNRKNVIPLCPNCHWEFDNLPRENLAPPEGIEP